MPVLPTPVCLAANTSTLNGLRALVFLLWSFANLHEAYPWDPPRFHVIVVGQGGPWAASASRPVIKKV